MRFSRQQSAIAIVVLAVIIVGGGAAGAFFLMQPQKTTPKATTSVKTVTTLSQLRTTLTKAVPGATATITTATSNDSLTYNPQGNKYYTGVDTGASVLNMALSVASMSQYTPDMTAITAALANGGFTATSTSPDNDPVQPFYIANWANSALTCDVYGQGDSKTATYNQTTQSYHYAKFDINVECAAINDFSVNAKALAPFYQTFTAATQNTDTTIVFGTPTVTTSKTDGYKTAQVPMIKHLALSGGSIGLFYQTPDGAWHYFMNTTSTVACPYYNTADLQKAYLGTKCQTAGTSSDVVTLTAQ